jgi:hypothetical protein
MAAWGIGSQVWWDAMAAPSLVGRVGVLACQLAVAVVLFIGSALILRCEELGWAWDLVRRKARRRVPPDRG